MQTETIWNDIYAKGPQTSSGKPGLALTQFAGPLRAGTALELGCARGDDAVWLAGRGWQITAVDVSSVALDIAARNAEAAGVAHLIWLAVHDLALSFPDGQFDLVTASFLHSPQDWPRGEVLAKGAAAVAPGGHLLIIEHASRAPWSWSPENTRFPTAEQTLASMQLDSKDWAHRCLCPIARSASGPGGQSATVTDNILFLQRLS
ncbi:class I SAM-dependent methyltransferase [Salipiger sp. IMCC34102]|uniref:class I SAM-dependent methyltransferase n=1 Tax=Salipiger sp. IMCC34102 TaxID=2510647 RepID=UPI00101CCC5B|nr:class I SAM-dependent methyltransferase [Salipiger sp. IMCC34102]RYH00896.1 class I SAM-dependent methyltransferase [Salipiger sp. IMCC34102]